MSKISVTTIAGLTSGGDANKVKIESGDTLQVESNATVGGTLTTTGTLTANGLSTLVGSTTHGTDAGDTRFNLNGPNQYRAVFKHAGNIAGQIGGGGADDLRFSNAAGATTMSIKDGHITMPTQTAFQAILSTTFSNFAANTDHTVPFATERFDQNADYNTSTYTFTAPVTGKYQLNVHILIEAVQNTPTYYQLKLVTSNKIYYETFDPRGLDQNTSYYCLQSSPLADMDASDTCYIQIQINTGSAQTDLVGTIPNTFTGCLLA